MFDKAKQHFRNNKKTYLACGVTAVLTGVAVFILTRDGEVKEIMTDADNVVNLNTKLKQIGAVNRIYNTTNVNFPEMSTPSKPVHMIRPDGTEGWFRSIKDAARNTGIDSHQISKVANGIKNSIDGIKFDFIEITEEAALVA